MLVWYLQGVITLKQWSYLFLEMGSTEETLCGTICNLIPSFYHKV